MKKDRFGWMKRTWQGCFWAVSLMGILIGTAEAFDGGTVVEEPASQNSIATNLLLELPNAPQLVSRWKQFYKKLYSGVSGNVMSFNYPSTESSGGLLMSMVPTILHDAQPNDMFPRAVYTAEHFWGYKLSPTWALEASHFFSQKQPYVETDGSRNEMKVSGYGVDIIKTIPFPIRFNLGEKFQTILGFGIEMHTVTLNSNNWLGALGDNKHEGVGANFRWTAGFSLGLTKRVTVRSLVRTNQLGKIPKLYPTDEYRMYSVGLQYAY